MNEPEAPLDKSYSPRLRLENSINLLAIARSDGELSNRVRKMAESSRVDDTYFYGLLEYGIDLERVAWLVGCHLKSIRHEAKLGRHYVPPEVMPRRQPFLITSAEPDGTGRIKVKAIALGSFFAGNEVEANISEEKAMVWIIKCGYNQRGKYKPISVKELAGMYGAFGTCLTDSHSLRNAEMDAFQSLNRKLIAARYRVKFSCPAKWEDGRPCVSCNWGRKDCPASCILRTEESHEWRFL